MARFRRRKMIRRRKPRRTLRKRKSMRRMVVRVVKQSKETVRILGSKRLQINSLGPNVTTVDCKIDQGFQVGTVSIDRTNVWGRPGADLQIYGNGPGIKCMKGNKIQRQSVTIKALIIPTLCYRVAATQQWAEWQTSADFKNYDITGTIATYNAGVRIVLGYGNRQVTQQIVLDYLMSFVGEQTTDYSFTQVFDRSVFVPTYDKVFYTSLAAQKPTRVFIKLRGKRGKRNLILPYDLTTGALAQHYTVNGNMFLIILSGYTNWIDPRTAGNTLYDRIACQNEVNLLINTSYKDC